MSWHAVTTPFNRHQQAMFACEFYGGGNIRCSDTPGDQRGIFSNQAVPCLARLIVVSIAWADELSLKIGGNFLEHRVRKAEVRRLDIVVLSMHKDAVPL